GIGGTCCPPFCPRDLPRGVAAVSDSVYRDNSVSSGGRNPRSTRGCILFADQPFWLDSASNSARSRSRVRTLTPSASAALGGRPRSRARARDASSDHVIRSGNRSMLSPRNTATMGRSYELDGIPRSWLVVGPRRTVIGSSASARAIVLV